MGRRGHPVGTADSLNDCQALQAAQAKSNREIKAVKVHGLKAMADPVGEACFALTIHPTDATAPPGNGGVPQAGNRHFLG